jgi:DinB superfamily
MNLPFYILRLKTNAKVIENLISDVEPDQAIWKSAPEKWSIVEAVFHLYQTESGDFRPRLEKNLRNPLEDWDALDAEIWNEQRVNNRLNLGETARLFLNERARSIEWLAEIKDADWSKTHRTEKLTLSAGDLLSSWIAHDLLHIKQITRIHYDYVNFISAPYKTVYAGKWT